MACPAILTGGKFLETNLSHLDCQAQVIGSYGYGALADPGSTVSLALLGLLTVFVALFGIRLMLGYPVAGRDLVDDVIRIGLVLTLATSWPAWRVIGYDLVIGGPSEIAGIIAAPSGLPGGDNTLQARLQNADDGLVAMTKFGTGRLTGGVIDGSDLQDSSHGIALADETGLGWGRVLYLAGTIGPYAIARLGAGILLAITPLMAGFLLFGGTTGLFAGWLRGLAFCALGSLVLSLTQGVELAILEPWIADVLAQRSVNTFTPSAPTELIVLALAFATLSFGALFLAARIAFMPHFRVGRFVFPGGLGETSPRQSRPVIDGSHDSSTATPSRAYAIAEAVSTTMRREEAGGMAAQTIRTARIDDARGAKEHPPAAHEAGAAEMLGSSFRRTHRRASAVGERRDLKA